MTFPYGAPGEGTYAQCDPLIVDLVRKINADGRVQTVQSCEGHPWPMLDLVGPVAELMGITCMVLRALPEKWQLVIVPVVASVTPPNQGAEGWDWRRWRFTVIPSSQEPGAIAAARDVLGTPWR